MKEDVSRKITQPHPCVFCGKTNFYLLFAAPDFDTGEESFQLTRCISCNLVRTEPILDNIELEKYYSLSYYGSGKAKFIGIAETLTYVFNFIRASSILSHLRSRGFPASPRPIVLDIGCGRGNLLKAFKRMKCECHGVERTKFPAGNDSQDICFHKGSLQDISFAESSFDAAVIWHVLEHVENPVAMIQEAHRVLRPEGVLAIAVPNFGSLQAKIFRENWFHLDLPRHIHHFAPETLLRILNKSGFNVIRSHTSSIEQNPFGFVQSLFNKIIPFSKPNRFYSLLKKTGRSSFSVSLLMWAAFALLIFPFALLEYLISGALGRGATFVIYAKKC